MNPRIGTTGHCRGHSASAEPIISDAADDHPSGYVGVNRAKRLWSTRPRIRPLWQCPSDREPRQANGRVFDTGSGNGDDPRLEAPVGEHNLWTDMVLATGGLLTGC